MLSFGSINTSSSKGHEPASFSKQHNITLTPKPQELMCIPTSVCWHDSDMTNLRSSEQVNSVCIRLCTSPYWRDLGLYSICF